MKKVFLLICSTLFSVCMLAQEFVAPRALFFRSQAQIDFFAQFRKGDDGLYHYYETTNVDYFSKEYNKSRGSIEGLEHMYCYDNKNDMFFFYTDNTIGYYHPTQPQTIKFFKKCMEEGNVKKVKKQEAMLLTEGILKKMDETHKRKNDSIVESRRIKREKFVRDSIETAKREAKEHDAFRKTHDWRDLSVSRNYGIKCNFCDKSHNMKDYRVLYLNADTLYYLLEEPEARYIGINLIGIHYSTLTEEFKNDYRYKDYINIWRDSLANHSDFSTKNADVFNLVLYNEFKDKVMAAAPTGFMQKWGWNLNSAQGIEPYFSFFNTSKKTIKYVDFYFSIYNPVGDRCYLRYENSYIGNVRGVGPVEPFDSGSWAWDRATHYTSADASEMRIVKLVITYMDGTKKTIPNSSIIYDN